MKTFQITSLLLFLPSLLISLCSDGCLRCGPSSDCQICDLSLNYILNESSCKKITAENCLQIQNDGSCLLCDKSTIFDPSTKKCIESPQKLTKTNCTFYQNSENCFQCARNFYLQDGSCLPVQIKVPGCLVQNSTHCLQCEKNLILHPTRERCVQKPQTENCLAFGFLKCTQCKSGFILNENYQLKYYLESNIEANKGNEFFRRLQSGFIDMQLSLPSSCEPPKISNCLEFENFQACKKCENFYILTTEKKCVKNPYPIIQNCEIYSNFNVCVKCVQGFLLSNSTECNPVKEISECLKYNQVSPTNLCIECKENFYLLNNQCQQRLVTIANCATKNINKDECSICATGFKITDDFLKCLTEVQNCLTYGPSNTGNTSLTCISCKNTFVLSSGSCTVGTLASCQVYSSATVCTLCDTGYYWNGTVCTQHTVIPQCLNYSQTIAQKCDSCNNTHILLAPTNKCKLIDPKIPNCKIYSSFTACQECNDYFYLNGANCTAIPESENCIKKNGSLCILCKAGYTFYNNVCQLPLQFQMKYCQKVVNDGLSTFACDYCKIDSIPFTYSSSSICVTETDEKSRVFLLPATVITNCIVYTWNGSSQQCVLCKEGFYPNNDKLTCVSTCPNSLLLQPLITLEGNRYSSYCFQDTTVPNCKKLSKVYSTTNTNACVECEAGFYRKIENFNNVQINVVENYENLTKNKPGIFYPGFKCEQITNPIYKTTGNTNPPVNCQAYYLNTQLYCSLCKFGFSGKVDPNDSNNLICDVQIKGCDAETQFGIFYSQNSYISKIGNLLTCHKCLTANRIPFIFLNNTNTLTKFDFFYGETQLSSALTFNGEILKCLEPIHQSFRMQSEKFARVFPENCGFGKFTVEKVRDFRLFLDNGDSSVLSCLLCKPGFKAIYYDDTNNQKVIAKCEQIENCVQNYQTDVLWFNACSQCQNNFAWRVLDQIIYFDECIKTPDSNCLIWSRKDITGHLSKNCFACKKGFHFNYDGLCEKFTAPLCEADQTTFTANLLLSSNVNHQILLNQLNSFNGCSKCQTGYVGLFPNAMIKACTVSNSVKAEIYAFQTNYIRGCKFHYQDTELRCKECYQNQILSQNSKFCVDSKIYPNCQISDNTGTKCEICDTNYVKVDGFCEKPIIKFCKNYSSIELFQKCTQCNDKYKLVENSCFEGHVKNCLVYNELQKCISCESTYVLIPILNSQYCVKMQDDFNCLSGQFANDLGSFNCQQCKTDFLITTDPLLIPKSICLAITPISNCLTYNNISPFTQTSFQCTFCNKDYFLKNNICQQRQNKPQNCQTFSPTEDFCQECSTGNYLTTLNECQPFPTGIFGCRTYKNQTTCEQCYQNMFLQGNSCVKVPVLNQIKNCLFYSDISTCSQCSLNYILIEKTCIPAEAKNCETFINKSQCKTCIPGYGLYKNPVTKNIDCVYIATQNCENAEFTFPFNCVKCKQLFYEDNGKCFSNEKFIPNCQYYATKDTCAQCEENYILSQNKKGCMEEKVFGFQPIKNCQNNQANSNPICQICSQGYQFYKNNCVQCKTQTPGNGCMYCEGIDQEICLICVSGYFMSDSKTCIKNGTTPPTTTTTNTTGTTTTGTTTTGTTTTGTTTTETTTTGTTTTGTTTTGTTTTGTTTTETTKPS